MTSITPISASDFSTYDNGNYQNMRGIASSTNGVIIYVCIIGVGVVKSADSGSTWSIVYANSGFYISIACSSDGNIVYAANLGTGLDKSMDAGDTWNQVTFLPNNSLPGGSTNPESPEGGVFPGYTLENIDQIACDSTGSKLIMTTNAAASIYKSINGGVTWAFLYAIPGYSTNPNGPTTIASNADGTILYVALNNTSAKNIITSKNSGVTWSDINMYGISGRFPNLSTNFYGDFVFAVDDFSNLNTFYPTHADSAILVPGGGNTYSAIANYNTGNNLIISQSFYPSTMSPTITGGVVVLYSITNKYPPAPVSCFKEDTNILCFKDNKEVYVKIQDLQKGDLVKTYIHGYVPVNMLGTAKVYNPANTLRGQNRLYVCRSTNYPEVTEDLIITGCHSILVNHFTDKQREITKELMGNIYITDGKARLMACIDERAEPYEEEGVFTIWHLALDHDNYYMNYGIYANGLLVETCSKRYLKELSGMTCAF